MTPKAPVLHCVKTQRAKNPDWSRVLRLSEKDTRNRKGQENYISTKGNSEYLCNSLSSLYWTHSLKVADEDGVVPNNLHNTQKKKSCRVVIVHTVQCIPPRPPPAAAGSSCRDLEIRAASAKAAGPLHEYYIHI